MFVFGIGVCCLLIELGINEDISPLKTGSLTVDFMKDMNNVTLIILV